MKSHRASILAAIALLGLTIFGCGGDDDGNPVTPPAGADVTIIINGQTANPYSPDPESVTVGQTVAWRNNNGTAHTATADNGTAFGTGIVSAGATSTKVAMNNAGSFTYHCTVHPGMTGTLVVVP